EREQLEHTRRRGHQQQPAPMPSDGDVGGNQFAEARAVDVAHTAEVQYDVLRALLDELRDRFLERPWTVVYREATRELQDSNTVRDVLVNLHATRSYQVMWRRADGWWLLATRRATDDRPPAVPSFLARRLW